MDKHWLGKEWWAHSADVANAMSLLDGQAHGTTVSVNHTACSDFRHRLRVTKVENHNYLAFCHNCNARGFKRTLAAIKADDQHRRIGTHHIAGAKYTWAPFDHSDVEAWYPKNEEVCRVLGIAIGHWMLHVSPAALAAADIAVDTWSNYALQFRNDLGEVYCGQVWERHQDGSKKHEHTLYVTQGQPTPEGRACVVDVTGRFLKTDTCVLVEDRVSAMLGSIARPDVHWISLHGTHMDVYDMAKVGMYYNKALVWLDNDNDEVRLKSKQYRDYLTLMGVDAQRQLDYVEVKKCPYTVVSKVLGELLKI